MKHHLLILIVLMWLFPCQVIGGKIADEMAGTCPDEYADYKKTIHDYAIRMEEYVPKFGCKVIGIYALFADNHMEVIDGLEEDENLMEGAVDLFSNVPGLVPAMRKAPQIFETMVLTASSDKQLSEKLIQVYSSLKIKDYRKIEKDARLFLYPFTALLMANGESKASEIRSMAKRLERKVSVEKIETYTMLLMASKRIYPNTNQEKRMSYVDLTLNTIDRETLDKIQSDKSYLIYFLPPDENLIKEAQNIGIQEVHKIQKDYVKLMSFVFEYFANKSRPNLGLIIAEIIQGHLIDALRYHGNGDEIEKYLRYQFDSRVFTAAFYYDFCNKDDLKKIRYFFSMYSPRRQDTGRIVDEAKGNLGLIAKWFARGGDVYLKSVLPEYWVEYVRTMYFLPSINFALNPQQKLVFEDLLFNFYDQNCQKRPDLIKNAFLILTLYEKTSYFSWINKSQDAFELIEHNSDADFGRNSKKYKFIMLTSYPGDSDRSLFCEFIDGEKIFTSTIQRLMWMSEENLEEHNFTEWEKNLALGEDVLDYALLVTSIATIPITGGTSSAVTAATLVRIAARTAAKQAMKSLAKRGFKKLSKEAAKTIIKKSWDIGKNQIYQAAKEGGKNLNRDTIKQALRHGYKYYSQNETIHFVLELGAINFISLNREIVGFDDPCEDDLAYR